MKKAALATALVMGTSACAGGGSSTEKTTLTVFAAASLTEAFTTIGHDFERTHPGVTVRFSFAGSQTLAQQLASGAPADVFASASSSTMSTVRDLAQGSPAVFARNQLALAVAPAVSTVRSLADAASARVKLAVCAAAVPCGAAARKLLAAEHLVAHPVTEEQDVKGVLAKVELGEVDCGLVYVTDVIAAKGKVREVDLPDVPAALATYPIAPIATSKHLSLAEEFVAFVQAPAGQQVLHGAGFLPPT